MNHHYRSPRSQRPWTPDEARDAQDMAFADFAVKYPDRTYTAWTNARLRARRAADEHTTLAELAPLTTPPAAPPPPSPPSSHQDRFFRAIAANGLDQLPPPDRRRLTISLANEMSRMTALPHADPATPPPPAAPPPGFWRNIITRADGEGDTISPPPPTPEAPAEKKVIRYQDFEADGDISDTDFLDAFISWQNARNAKFAATSRLDHRLRISTADDGLPIAIAFPSDWHLGNAGVDHARIVSDVDLLCSHPRLFCALGGDPIDNFIIDKMIAASRSQLAQVDAQWVMFRALVNKLSDSGSLLFVGSGNHDQWTERLAGIDGITSALRGKRVLNTGEGGFIEVEVGSQTYGIYRKHKPTRFNSHYNPTHFLKQMLRMGTPWDFDIGVSEHFHNCNIELGEHRPGTGRDRLFITTGSYKVKDPYAEGLGYYGGGYGVPVVVLFPDRHEMMPFKRLSQAITVLDAYARPAPITPKAHRAIQPLGVRTGGGAI